MSFARGLGAWVPREEVFGVLSPETAIRVRYRGRWLDSFWGQLVGSHAWDADVIEEISRVLARGERAQARSGSDELIIKLA